MEKKSALVGDGKFVVSQAHMLFDSYSPRKPNWNNILMIASRWQDSEQHEGILMPIRGRSQWPKVNPDLGFI
jgi:hypothetical protein